MAWRGLLAGCLVSAVLTFGATSSAAALILPLPIPTPTLPPLPSPSIPPLPSPTAPPLPSPVPSSQPLPTSIPGAGIAPPPTLPALTATPGVPDPGNLPLASSSSSAQRSSSTDPAPSPANAGTGGGNVCPILGGGGSGCQSLPAWLVQQLAETGYPGIFALLAGVILTLAGIGGLLRRRRQALS